MFTQSKVDDPLDQRVTSVGCVHPHLQVKIVDPPNGHLVPRGGVGELCTRGYSVILGYWADLHATRAAIDAARCMHTGDLAVMDNDGYVNIVGRIKHMVMRGGENIFNRQLSRMTVQRASSGGRRRLAWVRERATTWDRRRARVLPHASAFRRCTAEPFLRRSR